MIVHMAMLSEDFKVYRVYPHHVHLDARPGPTMFLASPAE